MLQQETFKSDIRLNVLALRTVKAWSNLLEGGWKEEPRSLEAIKTRLDKHLSGRV